VRVKSPTWQNKSSEFRFFALELNVPIYNSQIMATTRELIEAKAIDLLKSSPQGMRTSKLIKAIQISLPNVHPKTINGTVWLLHEKRPEEVYKPSRGLFRHVSFREDS
jgi:hypothetical protein